LRPSSFAVCSTTDSPIDERARRRCSAGTYATGEDHFLVFKDYFSVASADYARFRPEYPEALFAALAETLPESARDCAWDCATGNGQAARSLAPYFGRVIASDASAGQIENAISAPGVEYRVFPAEGPKLPDASVDLVTVAQALHWFDLERFYAAVRRVARPPHAVLATWGYGIQSVSEELDPVIMRYYHGIVGSYWPPERRLIEGAYQTLAFPFKELAPPELAMERPMNLAGFLGYLGTWSATNRYRQDHGGEDPRELIADELARLWGDPETMRPVHWKLFARVGRVFG